MWTWRSLQRQTYADWEWVIVDDHSSDQSTLEALWEAVDRRDLHCSPTPLLHGRRVLPFGSLKCTTLPEVISPMSTDTTRSRWGDVPGCPAGGNQSVGW